MRPVSDEPSGTPGQAVVLGIDLGTTGVKALLVETGTGRAAGLGYRSYPSRTDRDGCHEQDADDWWVACCQAVREALGGTPAANVLAVGLSGHMHAVVLVDGKDRYVRPAMTWADRRSVEEVRRLREHGDRFTDRCANPVVEAFPAAKVAWLRAHEPDMLVRAVRLVQPKDSLRHRLTGSWGTDVSDARGTLLYDVHRDRWDPELWQICGADLSLAPEVTDSTTVVGSVTGSAADRTGLAQGTPVVAGAGDVSCSALGAGVIVPGMVYVNAGTAAQVLTAVQQAAAGEHFVFGRADSRGYLAMASVYAAGLGVDWAARTIVAGQGTGERSARDLDRMAAAEGAGADGAMFVPHLLGTSVPTHNPEMRGALLGLGADHRPATVARAVLEGVGYACADAAGHVASLTGQLTEVRLGGGLSRSAVWAETLSAVLDVPVRRLLSEASPLGAAMLAGLGVGVWEDASEAAKAWVRTEDVTVPGAAGVQAYRCQRRRYDRAVRALAALTTEPEGQVTRR